MQIILLWNRFKEQLSHTITIQNTIFLKCKNEKYLKYNLRKKATDLYSLSEARKI